MKRMNKTERPSEDVGLRAKASSADLQPCKASSSVIEPKPRRSIAWRSFGLNLVNPGRKGKLVRAVLEPIEIDQPDAAPWLEVGDNQLKDGNYRDALGSYLRVAVLWQYLDDPSLLFRLGEAELGLGKTMNAARLYRLGLALKLGKPMADHEKEFLSDWCQSRATWRLNEPTCPHRQTLYLVYCRKGKKVTVVAAFSVRMAEPKGGRDESPQ